MSKYRIMIIDDDDDARQMLTIALRERFEVVQACDGLDALSKLEAAEPDFAIIDIMMPLMDGYQVCEAIRRNPRFVGMQVMFLSAYGSKEHIKKSYAVGGNLFMTKPVDPDRVLRNIDFTIKHEPPPLRPKRYTLEQLERLANEQKAGGQAPATAAPQVEAAPAVEPIDSAPASQPSPAPASEQQRPASAPLQRPVPGQRPRILAIDDDPELLAMLDMALRDDYEVTTASNGLEAIERIVEYNPDLLLLDIMMPKMNGYQLLQSLRRNQYYRTLPVIVVSAKSSARDREYAQRLGANRFLGKPFRIDDLMAQVLAATQEPSFRIWPKKMTLFEIHEKSFSVERLRREKEKEMQRKSRYQELKDVIDSEKD